MFILIVKYFDISLVEAKVFLSQENAGNPERIRMSLAGAGQRRYLAGVERRQLDMLGPVSFLSFTIQLDMLGPVSFLSFTIQLDMLGPVSFISFTI